MRVRHLVAHEKLIERDTGWRDGSVQRRHVPVLERTMHLGARWKWRSAKLTGGEANWVVFAQASPSHDNWKAWLMVETGEGWSLVTRYEFHGFEPGLHAHSNCNTSGILTGPTSIDPGIRIPNNHYHRRTHIAWTLESFWSAALEFFRVQISHGPLFEQAEP